MLTGNARHFLSELADLEKACPKREGWRLAYVKLTCVHNLWTFHSEDGGSFSHIRVEMGRTVIVLT